jgi:hypothetical protein
MVVANDIAMRQALASGWRNEDEKARGYGWQQTLQLTVWYYGIVAVSLLKPCKETALTVLPWLGWLDQRKRSSLGFKPQSNSLSTSADFATRYSNFRLAKHLPNKKASDSRDWGRRSTTKRMGKKPNRGLPATNRSACPIRIDGAPAIPHLQQHTRT